MSKNYYEILGITDDEKKLQGEEFEKILKQKYRKLALQYHPDRQSGKSDAEKKEAEEKFKDASEAYDTLLNKRAEYDNPVTGGMNFNSGFNFSHFNMDDILRDFGFDFGGFGGRTGRVINKGSDIRIRMKLSLSDMYNGVSKKIKYNRYNACDNCGGKGLTKDSKFEKCGKCNGTGRIYSTNGIFQTMTTCPYCHGQGNIITNPCPKCGGHGIISTEQEVDIDIPKGAFQGMQLVLKGNGNAPEKMDGQYGDLYVVIINDENEKFTRNGDDIYCKIDVPVIDAMLGCNVTIETINGKKLSAKIPSGTEDGGFLRFVGCGMPIYGTNNYGNMMVEVKLKMPKSLTNDERSVLEGLKKGRNFQ